MAGNALENTWVTRWRNLDKASPSSIQFSLTVIMENWFPDGVTVNQHLQKGSRNCVRKGSHMWQNGFLHQDNIPAHTLCSQSSSITVHDYNSNSPDRVPCDFSSFPLKSSSALKGTNFESVSKAKKKTTASETTNGTRPGRSALISGRAECSCV